MVAIRDSLSDLASSDNGEDGEDQGDEETAQGKLSKYDKCSWVMGEMSTTVQQHMERFRQMQMKLDELTQRGSEGAADYHRDRDMKYGISNVRVPAVFTPQTDDDAAAPAPTIFGELMECLDSVPGMWPVVQGISRV